MSEGNNCKGSFEKVENHITRILEVIDKHTLMIAELKFNINNLVKFQEGYINRIINLESVLTKNLKFWVEKAFWDKNREFFNGLLKELSSEGDSLPRLVIPHCEDIDEEGECTSLGGLCMDNLDCENKETSEERPPEPVSDVFGGND